MNKPTKEGLSERAAGRCEDCGISNRRHFARYGRGLHAHRIIPGSEYTPDRCEYLCMRCHWTRHGGNKPPARLHRKYRRFCGVIVKAEEYGIKIHRDAFQALRHICEDNGFTLDMGLDVAIALLEEEVVRISENS